MFLFPCNCIYYYSVLMTQHKGMQHKILGYVYISILLSRKQLIYVI